MAGPESGSSTGAHRRAWARRQWPVLGWLYIFWGGLGCLFLVIEALSLLLPLFGGRLIGIARNLRGIIAASIVVGTALVGVTLRTGMLLRKRAASARIWGMNLSIGVIVLAMLLLVSLNIAMSVVYLMVPIVSTAVYGVLLLWPRDVPEASQ